MIVIRLLCALAIVAVMAGCSKTENTPPTTPSPPTGGTPPPAPPPPGPPPPPPSTATIVITSSSRFEPSEVTVALGGRVQFVNNDNRPHDISSDPPHIHTDCPEVMEVGFLTPGQAKFTPPLNVARTCGFHDHIQENNPDLRGRIIIVQ
jgi:hypothetical protein